MTSPLRIGILGAAGIAPPALIDPAASNDDVEVVVVAARDPQRARAFADEHDIPVAHETYDDVIADKSVDAIYIALPNSHHARWTIAALQAGKHVLVEKPFSCNAAEAREVASVAQQAAGVCMEAFHYRFHPQIPLIENFLAEIGPLQQADGVFNIHLPDTSNIRYQYDLAGGATMDLGCYPLHLLRTVLGVEPQVVSASARTAAADERVDEALTAHLRFGDIGSTITSSLNEAVQEQSVTFTGTHGTVRVDGFVHPHKGNEITITRDGQKRVAQAPTSPTSYEAQLAEFVAVVRGERPCLTDPADSIATMEAIDAMYTAAGLPLR